MPSAGRDHAVVMGGSMAGLAAARALATHFERVTIVERDLLPTASELRKGVPQGAHAHGLLSSGYRVLDEWFPGLMDELEADGAIRVDVSGDFLWYHYGHWKLRADCGLGGIVMSRSLLEAGVRRRVRSLANVTVLDGHDFVAPTFDAANERVTGLGVTNRSTSESVTLSADLVVDASGRGSQSPKWIASWGLGEVPEVEIKVDVGYATAMFERRPGDLSGKAGGLIAGTPPASRRYGALLAVEGDRWLVTLVGMLRDYPPTELAHWKEFARGLPAPDLYDVVKDRAPLGPVVSHRFPANRRRMYSQLARLPAGFLVTGDAACSFNPLYGQGMSIALCEAQALEQALETGDGELAPRFFAESDRLVDMAWAIATGEDFRYAEVQGIRPKGYGIIRRYLERAHVAASRDPIVLRRFMDVMNLLRTPTSLLSLDVAWRVLLGGRATQSASAQSRPK